MKKISISLVLLLAVSAFAQNTPESASIYERVIDWYNHHLNYGTISLLMAIESSFIPFPSELVVPPTAYKAFQPDSELNIFIIFLAATFGALVGAYVNYFLAKALGRPIIYKFADSRLGHMCLIDSSKVKKAEDFFIEHGNLSTLVGRLIPGIRQLISIPAGLAKMKLLPFTIFTLIGAAFWNIVLIVLGYLAHGQKDLIEKYNHEISLGLAVLGVLFISYLISQAFKKKPENKETSEN